MHKPNYKILLLLVTLVSCLNQSTLTPSRQKNDTNAVMKLALHTAFENNKLPSIDPLKKEYHYRDSIILTSEILQLASLPTKIDTLNFKVLSGQQITELVKAESDLNKLPNYLNVQAFEKTDSGYYVSLQSLSNLNFGGGGQIGIYIEKQNDSFTVKKTFSSSIN